jgi:hypothetical protein
MWRKNYLEPALKNQISLVFPYFQICDFSVQEIIFQWGLFDVLYLGHTGRPSSHFVMSVTPNNSYCWKCCSSGLWRRGDSKVGTFVSERHTVSISNPENGDRIFLRTLLSTFESTRRHNREDQQRNLHRRENLKSHIMLLKVLREVFYRNFLK